VIRIEKFLDDGEDVLRVDGNTAFFGDHGFEVMFGVNSSIPVPARRSCQNVT
jgi:hypothetical protein